VAAQPIAAYEVPGAADAGWLRVRPTTRHGAPARGAVVRLETTAGIQRRTVDAGGGCLCQTEPVAHFGLGGATPRRVVVRWPDGRERILPDPASDAEIAVEHPSKRRSPPGGGRRPRGDRPLGR
ncbi:ASPIC/UnbV domain-containing protein, partial [Halorubrum sp. Ea8]|uniref:ASPIC/UnbV domain-containing protein n=2 Tax=Halorubrum TaxID=56688 RepID=UPI000BDDE118